MDLPNEMVFPVNAHHRNICRYPTKENETYLLVESSILEIASTHPDALLMDLKPGMMKLTVNL